ncbi:uncharacterized protein RHO25_011233 [Cercospora beticola]|uniref:Uncharacterized protein n=1 Tax=Cercospora beticola TaxID=122368 RepID=A0ABZ0P4D6_CERBT|nr:hypothetical protein RHO25_011233 [Cercospora beticola]
MSLPGFTGSTLVENSQVPGAIDFGQTPFPRDEQQQYEWLVLCERAVITLAALSSRRPLVARRPALQRRT